MKNKGVVYDLEKATSGDGLKFVFISKGAREVLKVVQYTLIQQLAGIKVYNLGFGDFNPERDDINDHVTTDNGDGRRVFNTVLSTIPLFFTSYPGSMLMVQGSDSRSEFKALCKERCINQCGNECRKFNQRIRIYRLFIDTHYEELNTDYQFFGLLSDKEGNLGLEGYEIGRDYISVIVIKKTLKFVI